MNNALMIVNPKAKIYDVRSDSWLGDKNNISYCHINRFGHLLFLSKSGELKRNTKKVRGIVKHLSSCTVMATTNTQQEQRMLNVALQSELDFALAEKQLSFYDGLPDNSAYLRIDMNNFQLKHCCKSTRFSFKERYALAHSKSHDDGLTYESVVSSSMYADPMQFLAANEQIIDFHSRCEAVAKRIGVSLDCYQHGLGFLQGHGLVNLALLHVAQLLGGKANIFPYDPETRVGKVTLGTIEFSMTETMYMDLKLSIDGQTVSSRNDIYSIPVQETVNASAIIPQTMLIMPLSIAAFEMLREQDKTLRKALRATTN